MADGLADETIVTEFIVKADEALKQADAWRTKVDTIKKQLQELVTSSKKSFVDVAKGMSDAFKTTAFGGKTQKEFGQIYGVDSAQYQQAVKNVKEYNAAMGQAVKESNAQFKEGEKAVGSYSKSLFSLGNVIKGVFVGLIYNVAMNILRGFTQLMSEATTYAYDLVKGVFQLELGIRALRRSGIDITFEDTVKQIKALREEFGIFTTKELVQGTAAFYNLIRDLGFTREEIEKLQRSIVTLAIVNGRSMDDVQKTVALALSSGYTEGLQRLGVSINRVNIAQQAATMGWEKGYMALTEQQRAMATLVLLNQKVAKYSNDVTKYQETEAGQIDVTTKAIEEQSTIIGQKLLPIKKAWLDIELALIVGLGKTIDQVEETNKETGKFTWIDTVPMLSSFIKIIDFFSDWRKSIQDIGKEGDKLLDTFESWIPTIRELDKFFGDFGKRFPPITRAFERVLNDLRYLWDGFINDITKPKKDIEINATLKSNFGEEIDLVKPESFDELATKIEANFKDALEDIFKAQEEFEEDSTKSFEDYKQDLAEISEDYNQDLEDAERKHYQELEDIARKFSQDIADALTDYQSDVIDVWNEYYAALEDAAYDYRQAELQSEKDYQEDLLRLRESFLFDLEDALQARDARAVMNIVRRYNLEKEQAKRSYEDEQDQNRQKYDDTVREAKRQREARLAELYKELAERLGALALQNARELEEERINYERELEEERINWERRRGERSREYALELSDLVKSRKELLIELARSLVEQADTTETGMENMRKVLEIYLGEGGLLDDLWNEYEKLVYEHLDDINTVIEQSLKAWNKAFGKAGEEDDEEETNDTGGSTESNTTGSTTSPTKGTTGKAATTNLGNSSTAANTTGAATSPTNGKLTVDINLSKGLESEIIDEAMNGMADVLFRSTRQ